MRPHAHRQSTRALKLGFETLLVFKGENVPVISNRYIYKIAILREPSILIESEPRYRDNIVPGDAW